MVSIVTDLFTGHSRLNRYMCTIGLAEDETCRFSKEEKGIAGNILCNCKGSNTLTFIQIGVETSTTSSYTKEPLLQLWDLIKWIKLNNSL